jgi:hypothetical protein
MTFELTDEQRRSARWLVFGTLLGLIASGWGLLYPAGRAIRGVLATGFAESFLASDALGDAGASVGILQFNDVNKDLMKREGWRLSPFYSGFAVARYLASRDAVVATLRPGVDGLAAWRSAWVRGRALEPGDHTDVGPLARLAWESIGARYQAATIGQYVALALLVVLMPPIAVVLLAVVTVGALVSGVRPVDAKDAP